MIRNDLTSLEWCEIVFDGRNKKYGAYKLRAESPRRHGIAVLIVLVAAIVLSFIPVSINWNNEKKRKAEMTEVLQLSKLKPFKEEHIEPVKYQEKSEAHHVVLNKIKFTPPVIKEDDQVDEDNELQSQSEMNNENAIGAGGNTEEIEAQKVSEKDSDDDGLDTKIFRVVEQLPEFPGGISEYIRWLTRNLQYPISAQQQKIEGKVVVQFIVNKDGSISDVSIVRSLYPDCDKEVIRVMSMMPKWKPGKEHNVPVRAKYVLPVIFKLD